MQFLFPDIPHDNYSQWAFYNSAFTSDECEKIKAMMIRPEESRTGSNDNPSRNTSIRKSEVQFLPFNDETSWIFIKLSNFILGCNSSRYKLDLSGFGEHLQLGRYSVGDHYSWHQDSGGGEFSTRKLSLVLQLSKPEDYKGGELQFLGYDEKVSSGQGDLILFPSFNPHRVTEVTEGERYSLVAWISGPPYR